MEKLDTIVRIIEWLAMPLAYFILLVLFLFFIVRPFFSYLFNWNRINALKILQEAQQELEVAGSSDPGSSEQQEAEDDESFMPPPPDSDDDMQAMSRLAKGNPEKAGTLVKQWIKKDQEGS